MKSLLSSLLEHPTLYYSLALAILFAFAALAVADSKELGKKRKFEWSFLAFAGSTLFIWRLPILLWPHPLNIDEGHWAACALKATCDLAPWRGFDATTSGPLNADILALPAIFAAPITFFSTRIIGCVLIVAAIYAFYFITKWTHGSAIARLAIVPPLAFLALTWQWDFLHYSSEEFPIFLTTLGIAAGAYLIVGKRGNARTAICWTGGLLLGASSFAKLQVLPMALAAVVFIAAMIHLTSAAGKQKLRENVALGFGFAAVPLVIAISLIVTGEWNDFVISYIKSAVVHVTSGTTVGPGFFFLFTATYGVFAACALGVMAIGLVALPGRWRLTKGSTFLCVAASGFLFISVLIIMTPRHAYPHYLLFSVLPLSYALATVLQFTREAGLWQNRHTAIAATVTAIFIGPALAGTIAHPSPRVGELRYLLQRHPGEYSDTLPFQNPAAQTLAISKYAPPGSRVSIWGWMPHYYVQTQTIMATHDAHTKPQLTPGPYQDYFRERYLADLCSSPPPVFVDAVAPGSFGYNQRATDGFETFPALAAFIAENYQLAEEIAGIRIFTLKKKATEKNGR